MSRWITITADHLKAAGHGSIVDSARTLAVGGIDPVQQAIEGATARVLRAIAPGNVLDADPTKIPKSFESVAVNLALFALCARIGFALSQDQSNTQRDITSDLIRTADEKLKVELPDNPSESPTFTDTGMKVSAVNVPRRQTGRNYGL